MHPFTLLESHFGPYNFSQRAMIRLPSDSKFHYSIEIFLHHNSSCLGHFLMNSKSDNNSCQVLSNFVRILA